MMATNEWEYWKSEIKDWAEIILLILSLPFLLVLGLFLFFLYMVIITSVVWIPLSVVGVIVYYCMSLFV